MSHTHLTSEERFAIELFLRLGMSCREIAGCLGRSHTTISRELCRNGSMNGYRFQTAQRRAESRRRQPRHYRRQQLEPLVAYVDRKLRSDWAPEQIAGRIRLDHRNDQRMRISTETIYRRHPLFVLANQIDWAVFGSNCGRLYADKGRPALLKG